MEIVIAKGTILGFFMAIVFAIAAGYIAYAITFAITWSRESGFPVLAATVISALLAGWGGWELGHWFTS